MRISAVAKAAGVTTRTVRYYHQLGVLPEPARTANGYRDYSFADLTRLLRLRWLATSGLSLATASPGSAHGGQDLLEDVDTALARLEEEAGRLLQQKQLLIGLRDNLAAGRRLSPLPGRLNQHFEDLLRVADPAAQAALLTEREVLESLALTGGGDPELYDHYDAILSAPDAVSTLLPLLARFSNLRGADPAAHAGEICDLGSEIADQPPVARFVQYVAGGVTPEEFTRVGPAPLDRPSAQDILPDPAQRAVLGEILRRVRR